MVFDDVRYSELSRLDLVRLGYVLLLRRNIDATGLAYWIERIETHQFDLASFIETLIASPEYKTTNQLSFATLVHQARQAWIKQIGAHQTVLDIGGSSPNIDLGAMIELGYQHRPQRLTIFDLPPEQQYWGAPRFAQDRIYEFAWGAIDYVHGAAELIDRNRQLANRQFDLIFMGQVIEHLDPEALPRILKWIREHLSETGKFVFDTPNRLLTKIQSPSAYIDPDHKIEYTPDALRRTLEESGFRVTRQWGLLHMPSTYLGGSFDPLEVYETKLVSDRIEECYLFAMECEPRTAARDWRAWARKAKRSLRLAFRPG